MAQDKRIAVLMQCHTLPNQINDFIAKLNDKYFDFFLHVDRKSNIGPQITPRHNVYFVPDDMRIDVKWGGYSQVQASINLIETALCKGSYDYFWLCSGQDFPIKSSDEIFDFFRKSESNYISLAPSRNNPRNGKANTEFDKRCEIAYPSWMIGKAYFQRAIKKLYLMITGGTGHTFSMLRKVAPDGLRLYFGSSWWCLNRQTIEHIYQYIRKHGEVCDFFKKTLCPDESFFHTLAMNSPYRNDVKPNLVYVDWSGGNSSPKVLSESDFEKLIKSEKLIARKIDSLKEPELYKLLMSIG